MLRNYLNVALSLDEPVTVALGERLLQSVETHGGFRHITDLLLSYYLPEIEQQPLADQIETILASIAPVSFTYQHPYAGRTTGKSTRKRLALVRTSQGGEPNPPGARPAATGFFELARRWVWPNGTRGLILAPVLLLMEVYAINIELRRRSGYSWRSAVTGSRRAARAAGYRPAITPISVAKISAPMANHQGMIDSAPTPVTPSLIR